MELKQIKQNIWYILTIIGTSCGVIGGWFTCALKGWETGDMFVFWSGVITVVGMVIGTVVWCVKLIIEIKRYIAEKNKPYMAMKMNDFLPKIKIPTIPKTMPITKVDEKEKSKQKGDKNVSQNQ